MDLETRIRQRIAELTQHAEQVERDAERTLTALRTAIAELQALLTDMPMPAQARDSQPDTE